jgi:hypothetical protein
VVSPPVLPNGRKIRERLLIFGPPGVGKTHQFFVIAKWHQDLGSDAKFHGICTDTAYEALITNTQFLELSNLEWYDVFDFQDYVDAARVVKQGMRQQDWLSVDLLNNAWNAAQDEYAAALVDPKGKQKYADLGDMWATEKGTDYPIKGWDWGMINARYRVFANNYLLTLPGHLFLVAAQQEVMAPTDRMKEKEDATTRKRREMFKHLGVQPLGQKDDPFRYHTILHIDSRDAGGDVRTQQMATAKERFGNRRMWGVRMQNGRVRDEPIEDFFMDYLVKTAGWTV